MPKGTSWAEAMLNSEKTKPVALTIIVLWGIRQAVSQKNISIKYFFKIPWQPFESIQVDLKACLGLVT